jgi:hypothetical protein
LPAAFDLDFDRVQHRGIAALQRRVEVMACCALAPELRTMKAHDSEIASPSLQTDGTRGERINRAAAIIITGLSLIALLTVLCGYMRPPQPPEPDEGTPAHIFQMSIVLLAPAFLLFLATADWKQSVRTVRPLTFPAVSLVVAFGMLYCLEHYR